MTGSEGLGLGFAVRLGKNEALSQEGRYSDRSRGSL